VVLIPYHHTLRIGGMQQRLHRRIKKGAHGRPSHSPSWACCAQYANR
jgi:hypothetical protein